MNGLQSKPSSSPPNQFQGQQYQRNHAPHTRGQTPPQYYPGPPEADPEGTQLSGISFQTPFQYSNIPSQFVPQFGYAHDLNKQAYAAPRMPIGGNPSQAAMYQITGVRQISHIPQNEIAAQFAAQVAQVALSTHTGGNQPRAPSDATQFAIQAAQSTHPGVNQQKTQSDATQFAAQVTLSTDQGGNQQRTLSDDNTVSESVSRTSSLHDSTDSPDQRQIRDVTRRRGIRRRESIRRGTGRGSSRRGTGRESGSRGRGRVTRQRRGRGNQGPSKVALTAEARDYQLKERIANMTKEDKDSLLARICQKHPNMVFELINGSSMEQQGYHPRPGGESPSWCICNNCREMPTDEEKQC